MVRYRIMKDVQAPTPRRRARKKKWDIPIEDLEPGTVMLLEMPIAEARLKIASFRAFVDRQQKALGRKFSVCLTDAGIEVWLRSPEPEEEETRV